MSFSWQRHSGHRGPGGFTLIELCLVIALIATLMAIALPRFLPAISYSTVEGAALHLGHYGRAVMSQAVLSRELLTVKIDLDFQEYKTVHKIEELVQDTGSNKNAAGKKKFGSTSSSGFSNQSKSSGMSDDVAEKAEQMQEQFDSFARLALESRAKNVEQEGILSNIGPLFEKEFELDPKEEEKQYEDVTAPLLAGTLLPEGTRIEMVKFGGKEYVKGKVKIDISPLGLSESVLFYVQGVNGEYYSVLWDAITGEAVVSEGRQSLL